jgi:signal-transduction protein with cAMP-binding, CBS, and nucleotidyltransferase domain
MDEIKNFMSSPVKIISSNKTIEDAAKIMEENDISSIFVEENGDCVGIVTATDLVKRALAKGLDAKTSQISSVMSKPLIKMDHYLTRLEANEKMHMSKIKHLAVTKEGKVIGIITRRDII